MPTRFRDYQPDQILLLPPSLRDWLPEGHLAYFIADTIDQMDLSCFYGRYEGDGRRNQPFEPRMMVKILLYGYCSGVFSSRKMARKLVEDVAFRVLAAGNQPAHRTIAEFRQFHLAEFSQLFLEVLRLAGEAGMCKLGKIAVDGTKVNANASKHKAMSYKRMKEEEARLTAEIGALMQRAAAQDAQEDEAYGPDRRGDELPEELQRRSSRLGKIREAMARLKERQAKADRAKGRQEGDERKSAKGGRKRYRREFGEPEDKSQDNFTDPDSRIMARGQSFEQCYNAQAAVDEETRLIVATGLTQCAADHGQLLEMVEKVEWQAGVSPKEVLADAGYRDEVVLQTLEEKEIQAYVAIGREPRLSDTPVSPQLPATLRMREKLKTERGKARYARRKAIVEPVFGWIKEALGFRRFSLRGLTKVQAEWDLVCLAVNLKRMHVLMARN
jgi:transposase